MDKIDLYLWIEPKRDELYRLGNLTLDEANHYAMMWFEANETHDYMIVLEGSKPWVEPKPTIIDVGIDWIDEQIKEILNGSDK